MIAYKFLRAGRVGPFSGVTWPVPGEWLHAGGGARACERRVHGCRVGDLPEWIDHELWRIELDGDVALDCGKLVAGRGRLVERIAPWDAELMAAYAEVCSMRARDCALTVLAADSPGHAALAACADAEQLAAAVTVLGPLDARDERAAGYAGDAARHVIGARSDPPTAPVHAAVNGFVAAHAAAFAQDDVSAVERERAWQSDWIARRLAL